MRRRQRVLTLADTLFPYTTLFRSPRAMAGDGRRGRCCGRASTCARTGFGCRPRCSRGTCGPNGAKAIGPSDDAACRSPLDHWIARSEEHTSELQSLMRISYAVFCLKQKNHRQTNTPDHYEE